MTHHPTHATSSRCDISSFTSSSGQNHHIFHSNDDKTYAEPIRAEIRASFMVNKASMHKKLLHVTRRGECAIFCVQPGKCRTLTSLSTQRAVARSLCPTYARTYAEDHLRRTSSYFVGVSGEDCTGSKLFISQHVALTMQAM